MSFNFPASPALNDVYTDEASGVSWQWNGTIWTIIATPERPRDFVKLNNGAISSPVSYVDIALSGDYAFYKLLVGGMEFDSPDTLGGLFSFDGGTTWLYDEVNSDSYYFGYGALVLNNVTVGTNIGASQCPYLTSNVTIFPGSLSAFASVSWNAGESYPAAWNNTSGDGVNPSATVTPTKARATNIRIAPSNILYGIPGNSIGAGNWTLYGVV